MADDLEPEPERTRYRAYFLWENRSGRDWWNPQANWLQAEQEEAGQREGRMERCLFTGDVLRNDEVLEHTIPKKLGGRVRSRRVSSGRFNNATSQADAELISAYALIFNELGPVLANEHKLGAIFVRVEDRPRPIKLLSSARLDLGGMQVLERNDDGTPAEVVCPWTDLEGRIKQLGWDTATVGTALARVTDEPFFVGERTILSGAMEMAALKAIMLTLDEVLADSGKRFTRSPLLHRTRILVQQVMKEGALPRPEEYLPVVLGIQYDRIDDVLSARARLELPVQPFEHTLAVSGDVASRSLDVVWLCAGVDPWAFRLSSNWTEEDFTYVFAVGTTTLGPERASNWFAGPTSLCQPSIYRMLSPDLENDEFEARVLLPVASRRAEAYRKAVDLVERNCPAEVQDGLLSIARTRSPDQPVSVAALLRERLRRLFYRRLENGATAKAFDEIVKARMLQLDTASAQQMVVAGDEGSVQAVDWGGWHRVFVEVLDDLLSVAGLPGETFSICFRQESAP